jgi:hypothetical protein
MAGRQTFFSFHYDRDVWRASTVRNSSMVDATAAAGWTDKSLWEAAKAKGDSAVRKLIDDALKGTSVTVVLIGAKTASRRWVKYEIDQSVARGNGLLGVHIHHLKDKDGYTDPKGAVPTGVPSGAVYTYEFGKLAQWVEKAAVAAGKKCLPHDKYYCPSCG